jgi:AAA15 family ATPase/GTPase
MFGNNRDIKFPNKQLLIIRAGNKFILLDKSNRINSTEMLVILHLFFTCAQVKLHYFSVTTTAHKYVLMLA